MTKPLSVGIIMDGNRRYAKAKGIASLEGHRAGLEKAKEIARAALEAGIGTLYLYAFSSENWKRAPAEISYLLQLFEQAIANELDEFVQKGARLRFIGDLARFPEKLQARIREIEEKTALHEKGTIVIALSYGGRAEIVHGVNKLIQDGREVVSEQELGVTLWSGGLPDPDLIIRTGGEKRLSGFLTWQSIYSELMFTDTLWPSFTKEELVDLLKEFTERKRNFGV